MKQLRDASSKQERACVDEDSKRGLFYRSFPKLEEVHVYEYYYYIC